MSRGRESFHDRDHVVCFFVLRSRPNADHVRGPRHAAVWDTEQFPGLPGKGVGQDQASGLLPLPVTVGLGAPGTLRGTALVGARPWELEEKGALPVGAELTGPLSLLHMIPRNGKKLGYGHTVAS